MTLFQSILLGIVQGLAEFLPISSSAHLLILPWLLKWPQHSLTFDVALHLGTLAAIGVYFFKDYLVIIRQGITRPKSEEGRLFWAIILATLPAAVFGLMFESLVETLFRNAILLIALVLIVFGVVIFVVDRWVTKERTLAELTLFHAIMIGLSQAFALIPGVSRSGITITTGMLFGFRRGDAARFSFLMSGPVIFGAGLLSLLRNYETVRQELLFFLVGMISAMLVGLLTIHFLLEYLKQRGFTPFVVYRVLIALLLVSVYLMRV